MSALELNEMNITIAEIVTGNQPVCVDANELLPVTIANILDADFENDDEAEFIQGVLMIEKMIEDIILSDNPEDFLMPDADDLPPALRLLEYIDEIKQFRFAGRTLDRMDRRLRGQNVVVEEKLTQLQKSEHPLYKDWCCPDCLFYYRGARALRHHREREICGQRNTGLVLKGTKNKVVTPKFYHTAHQMNTLISRANDYKKNIEPELDTDAYVEDTDEETPVVNKDLTWCEGCEIEMDKKFAYYDDELKCYFCSYQCSKNGNVLIESGDDDDYEEDEENTTKRSIKITYSNGKVEWQNDEDGNIEWDGEDRDVYKLLDDAIKWGKTQDGLESICLIEFSSDGSSRAITKTTYEETEEEISDEEIECVAVAYAEAKSDENKGK